MCETAKNKYCEKHSDIVCLCTCVYLVLSEPPMDFLLMTDAVGDGSRQLSLNVRQPRTEVTHVLIQLLHRHQGLLQLLHSENTQTHWFTNRIIQRSH